MAIAILTYILVAWNARYPVVALDEIVMVGNSRVLAGLPATWHLIGAGFMPGLAVLMAPAWWLTDDPVTVYRMGIGASAVMGLLAIWPLSRIAIRFGASRNLSVIVASLVAVAPARSLFGDFLFAEHLYFLMTVCVILSGARLAERPDVARALVFGVAVGGAVLAHGRGAGLALAGGIWCLTLLRRARWHAVIAASTALVLSFGAFLMYRWVTSLVIQDDPRVSSTFGQTAGATIHSVVAVLIGQTWYSVLAWAGTSIVGAMWVARHLRASPLARLIGLAVVASLALSIVQSAPWSETPRFDLWFYGRYNDNLWAVLATLGVVIIVRLRWPLVSVLTVAVAAATSGLMLWVTAPLVGATGRWAEMHVLGVAPWLSIDDFLEGRPQPWVSITAWTVGLTFVTVVTAWWRGLVVPMLLIGGAALSLWYDTLHIDIILARTQSADAVTPFEQLPDSAQVAFDSALQQQVNMLYFQAGSRPVSLLDVGSDSLHGYDIIFSRRVSPALESAGGEVFAPLSQGVTVAWVLPGTVFEELERSGNLLTAQEVAGNPITD
ncbi:hypothetical protein [Demequina capsici]|uniref:Uncharacterized protein n=1 Tax=Demequina capsici TaxID=3075620 RepID=A0AA96JEJ9_9MICO|nr:hypothetical protein [Demequina sp. OYTSA14]WNM25784.1 hypothetical protein RN606_06445 [Demequina sp. OYTSA14]